MTIIPSLRCEQQVDLLHQRMIDAARIAAMLAASAMSAVLQARAKRLERDAEEFSILIQQHLVEGYHCCELSDQ